jgi:thiol-disulfide isomerase/thioredoxin/tetratricopeptide (TPR) repeat protein
MRRLPSLLLVLALGCASAPQPVPEAKGPVFHKNDYTEALAEARATHRLLFIDFWAPWCHSCVSMQAYVFPDAAMAPVEKRFVWLSVDTENPVNGEMLSQYPVDVWPTLLVVDPSSGKTLRRWLGSATAEELAMRLDAVDKSWRPGGGTDVAQRALADGAAQVAAGKRTEAADAYRTAAVASASGTAEHAQAVELLVLQLSLTQQLQECSRTARLELANIPPGTALANVAGTGLECAASLPESDPERKASAQLLETKVVQLTLDASVQMLADDRSGLFQTLVEVRKERGDTAGAMRAAADWAAYLEAEAARAKTPEARAVFDSHRLGAYLALGQPERAIPMLQQSQRDFPKDYNPPARMAVAYLAMKKPAQALTSAEEAEALVYGPRTLRVLLTKAEAQAALGDKAGAKATLAHAEALVASLPAAQRGPWMASAIDSKRKTLLQ